jgi:hypothetical protein
MYCIVLKFWDCLLYNECRECKRVNISLGFVLLLIFVDAEHARHPRGQSASHSTHISSA